MKQLFLFCFLNSKYLIIFKIVVELKIKYYKIWRKLKNMEDKK